MDFVLLYFVIASFLIVIVPGPTVSLIIANSLRSGVKAGLLNVIGTQVGVLILLFLLALGFEIVSPFLEVIINYVRILGSIYLISLGVIAINVFVFVVALIVWSTMKATMGIRLSKEAEVKGTDVSETGVIAYSIRD